jgi:hypothetical protein
MRLYRKVCLEATAHYFSRSFDIAVAVSPSSYVIQIIMLQKEILHAARNSSEKGSGRGQAKIDNIKIICHCLQQTTFTVLVYPIAIEQRGLRMHTSSGPFMLEVSVVSVGTSGPDWVRQLRAESYGCGPFVEELLCSPQFVPTKGRMRLLILRNSSIRNERRTTEGLLSYAESLGTARPNMEGACLIRKYFTDQDLRGHGLSKIIVAHQPASVTVESSKKTYSNLVLGISPDLEGNGINVFKAAPETEWTEDTGFAFCSGERAP